MADAHSASTVDLPLWLATGPGETDVLLIAMGAFLVLFVFIFGVLMLRLHHLPEHIASTEQKVQYQLVATLGLLGMFTHVNLFWIAGLLLALIDLPDFTGSLNRIASSVRQIASRTLSSRCA
jgi:hypothetical protein